MPATLCRLPFSLPFSRDKRKCSPATESGRFKANCELGRYGLAWLRDTADGINNQEAWKSGLRRPRRHRNSSAKPASGCFLACLGTQIVIKMPLERQRERQFHSAWNANGRGSSIQLVLKRDNATQLAIKGGSHKAKGMRPHTTL